MPNPATVCDQFEARGLGLERESEAKGLRILNCDAGQISCREKIRVPANSSGLEP